MSELADFTYGQMVKALAKPGEEILETLTPDKVHALHMSVGVGGEAGELQDVVKKYVFYNREFTDEVRADVVKEMGDLEFYLEGLRQGLGITREEVLNGNMNKLGKRYDGFKYSDERANERVDVK